MTPERAFVALRPAMFALAYRITGNRADSDDTGRSFGGGVMSGSRGLTRIDTTITGNFGTGGVPDDCTCFF